MNRTKVWWFVGVALLLLVCGSSRPAEIRFFRLTCLEGGAPENFAITSDEFGQIFLEFDSQDLSNYVIESTDSLWPSPAWAPVCSVIGDGQRIRWLATWQPIEWVSLTGEEEAPLNAEPAEPPCTDSRPRRDGMTGTAREGLPVWISV